MPQPGTRDLEKTPEQMNLEELDQAMNLLQGAFDKEAWIGVKGQRKHDWQH